MSSDPFATHSTLLDKRQYRAAFDRAAQHYDSAAILQQQVGAQLIERLGVVRLSPSCIIDVGAGTGQCATALAQRYKKAQVLLLDIAPKMLSTARSKLSWFAKHLVRQHQFICGDAECLPFADRCADLLFSNLSLQWCGDINQSFAEFRRVLKPGGLLQFTTLGPDTLKELRSSWQAVDRGSHVHPFIDMHHVGDALVNNGFADPVMDMETITVTYRDVYKLMRDLKTLGAHNAASTRPRGLTGKQRLQTMIQAYEQYRSDGLLPATYEVIYGHAWAPAADQSLVKVAAPSRFGKSTA